MRRHYALLFAFDIIEGVLNIEQHAQIDEATYRGLKIVLNNFLKEIYSPQEVFENYGMMRADASAGFTPEVTYNSAGVAYYLASYLQT